MSQYRGRHSARHAKPRPDRLRTVSSTLRRPAVSASLALAVVATGAAGVSAQDRLPVAPAAFSVSNAALGQRDDAVAAAEDTARLAAERASLNTQKVLLAAKAQEEARAKAAEDARLRQEEADRAAREAQRQSVLDNARTNPQAATQLLMVEAGFGQDQWGCLNNLVIGESSWNYRASNSSSGAYGLFQSLPGNKMSSIADDWADNPVTQIKWGLQYIKRSYGTPCGAWNFWLRQSPHWY